MENFTGNTERKANAEASVAEAQSLCESTRLALADEKPLSDAQNKHMEHCKFCQNFKHETELLQIELASLELPRPVKNGIPLADAVMQEIDKQAFFARTPSAKSTKHRLFRHAGLAAACFIVFVLAAPTMLQVLRHPTQDASLANDRIQMPETSFSAGSTFGMLEQEQESTDESTDHMLRLDAPTSNATDTPSIDAGAAENSADYGAGATTQTPAVTPGVSYADTSSSAANAEKQTEDTSELLSHSSHSLSEGSGTQYAADHTASTDEPSLTLKSAVHENTSVDPADMAPPVSELAADSPDSVSSDDRANGISPHLPHSTDAAVSPNAVTEAPPSSVPDSDDSDPASFVTEGGSSGGSDSSKASSAAPSSSSEGIDEAEHTDNTDRSGNSDLHTVFPFIETAFLAAQAHFGSQYAISTQNASYTLLSENRLCVDFAVELSEVHLQVFMVLTDGAWTVATDESGEQQIFEVTARNN